MACKETNNLKNNESAQDIATDLMNLAISVKNEKKTVVVSGITVRNDRFNDKEKNANRLLKRRFEMEKITVCMLNHSGLHLNERGTTRLVNNLCSTLAKWYLICVDTTFTEMNDLDSHQINVIQNLEPVSSKISTDRPLVNQITKISNLSSNAKNLDLNRNFNTFPLVQAHRFKNPKNVIIGHLTLNSLRNKAYSGCRRVDKREN